MDVDNPIKDLTPSQVELLRATESGRYDMHIWIAPIRQGKGVGSALAIINAAIGVALTGAGIRENQYVVGGATQSSFLRNNEGHMYYAAQKAGLGWAYRGSAGGLGAHLELGPGLARFFVMGGDNARSFQAVRGLTLRGAWLDEATLLDEEFWLTTIDRFSFDDSFMIATSNAGAPLHWLKTNWIDGAPETTYIIHPGEEGFDENVHYSDIRRQRLKDLDPNTAHYKRHIKNEWAADEGLIIPIPDTALTTETYLVNRQATVVLDPGTAGTTAALLFVPTRYGWLVADEYYHIGDRHGRLTDDQHLDAITLKWQFGRLLIDPAGASMEVAARRKGLAPRLAVNDFEAGIQVTNNALYKGLIRIHERCRNLRGECANYRWNPRERMPEVGPDHLADCLRYGSIDKFPNELAALIA